MVQVAVAYSSHTNFFKQVLFLLNMFSDIDIWNALPDDDDKIKVFGELAEKEVRPTG
jgi:hypothetical protein